MWGFVPAELLHGRTNLLQKDKAAHGVDYGRQRNFHGGPCDTESAYEQSHL